MKIYANFATKHPSERCCVLVYPALSAPLSSLPSGLIIRHQAPSSDLWQDLIEAFQSVLYCPMGNPTYWRGCNRSLRTLRRSTAQTQFRTLPGLSLLEALAVSRLALKTSLALDVALPRWQPKHWQEYRWQPSSWPHRWQLQLPNKRQTLSWQQLRQTLSQLPAMALVQTLEGNIFSPQQFCATQQAQSGRLIVLRNTQPLQNWV